MTIADIRPEEDVPALLKNISDSPKGIDNSGRWRHKRADETLIDVEIVSHELPFGGRRGKLVLVTDVSERNRLENQLRHAQRMEAIGQLAGGIAHDFNNLLTGIVGYSELLADDVGRETPTGQNVLEICELARKGTGLTRQLLAFGRRQVLQPTVFNLNTLVEGISKLLIRLLGAQIALRFSPADEQLNVRADSGQLEQVLVNLALNARDAMLRGGALTIATQGVMLAESRPGHAAHPQPYVQLSVSDTGSGMDKATQERIFEPFFTTKDKGRGTGLGLSVSYGIITQHGGRITVSSRPGEGTTFTVLLPRVDEQAA
jgi:two-component system cell cycle sensor histidine kinase/response regulator CckA